ncbi:transglutaminase-like putative cysteine protease [Crenobacter luteus]|uniref:transglutaminase family protein n=1 Tax=Crenobacter luteus TaxID=1452487 RepID=UPI001046943A|nr:transglutaminase family protein [Crenobacter luteus]TCP15101.1 transglutaminase-like putative cysteine protease [Crenobacter luteus]
MKLAIRHETVYRYDSPARRSTQTLRMTPRDSAHQRIASWRLTLPGPASAHVDGFGNAVHLMTLDAPHEEIRLLAEGVVETQGGGWHDDAGRLDPRVFCRATALTRPDDAIRALARAAADAHPAAPLDALAALSAAVLAAMPYTPGRTDAATGAAAALALGAGVCQDHTQVFLAACRALGHPARYVSGYLLNDDADHAASHAWAEVWQDGAWHGFDISNQRAPDAHHLKLAVGLDYLDACPVRGVRLGGDGERLAARADVRPLEQ